MKKSIKKLETKLVKKANEVKGGNGGTFGRSRMKHHLVFK